MASRAGPGPPQHAGPSVVSVAVAKQVLASMITQHATFVPVPRELLEWLCRTMHTFVAANRPVTGSAAALFPGKATCFRTGKDGGIALVDLSAQNLGTPDQGAWQAAEARAAGLEGLLRLLAAWQIPTLLQFPSRAAAGPGARAAVRARLPEAAASSPH